MRSKSQCFNIIHLAIGFTAGRLTLVTAQIALPLRYPFTPNGPRRLLLGTKRTGRSITYEVRIQCPLLTCIQTPGQLLTHPVAIWLGCRVRMEAGSSIGKKVCYDSFDKNRRSDLLQ